MAIEPTGSSTPNVIQSSGSNQSRNLRQADDQAKAVSSQQPQGDAVTLTASAENLRALEAKIASLPVVDTERVTQIRDAINNGEYKIDPESIAEKFLDLEKSLS